MSIIHKIRFIFFILPMAINTPNDGVNKLKFSTGNNAKDALFNILSKIDKFAMSAVNRSTIMKKAISIFQNIRNVVVDISMKAKFPTFSIRSISNANRMTPDIVCTLNTESSFNIRCNPKDHHEKNYYLWLNLQHNDFDEEIKKGTFQTFLLEQKVPPTSKFKLERYEQNQEEKGYKKDWKTWDPGHKVIPYAKK